MRLDEAIGVVADVRGDAGIVMGPGSACGMLFALGHRPPTVYNMEMGYPSAIALGSALAEPRKTFMAIEGDGSAIAGLSVFTTIAQYQPANLIVLVLDNGVYGTIGDGRFPTASGSVTSLPDVARGCGWDPARVCSVDREPKLREFLSRAVEGDGPWFIHARVEPPDRAQAQGAKPGIDVVESALEFRRVMTSGGSQESA